MFFFYILSYPNTSSLFKLIASNVNLNFVAGDILKLLD